MKKLLIALTAIFSVTLLAACNGEGEDLGEYRPGLHLGYTEGHRNDVAYVYVDRDGFIKDIFIDSVYTTTDDDDNDIAITKRTLDGGYDYTMTGNEDMLWVEQVNALAQALIDNQGELEDEVDEDGDLVDPSDALAGVTISVDGYMEAVGNALERARLEDGESPHDFEVANGEGTSDLEAGIHHGYTEGHRNDHAYIAVNEDGFIEHIKIDSVYTNSDEDENEVATTKRSLDYGYDYIMQPDNEYLWVEQVDMLAEAIVEAQAIESDLEDDPADAVSGVTISIDGYLSAIRNALDWD